MNGTVILNCLAELSSSNKILVFVCFSDKNTLQKTVFGCPCFVSLLGPGKVNFETLTSKRARKLRCGTQKWARRWKGAEIMAQNWTIAVGRLAPSPLACAPSRTSYYFHAPATEVIHIEYFIESAGVRYFRTSCWHSSRNGKSEISDIKTALRKYRTKHFPCGIVFVRYRDVHHWFC